ncbi:hypothetical protein CCMSSC00406_0001702 [Pleurotus cornucopiae]|uniref:Uncharacterized protein n=1 Tax=Pleurotus cornucopiae TaxID=5321 RepID=A0ACB7IM63_PLECO|nr:hypothetical protein CCMSSC00406_0001702 [Pleurotus cornucopiae]
MPPTDAEIATQVLADEYSYRFPSFSASDAVTLVGLSFARTSTNQPTNRHQPMQLLGSLNKKKVPRVLSSQQGEGDGDLGHESGIGDVSLDSWACVEGMINCVKRTGHSSYYVEKGMGAMGKTPKQLGIQGAEYRIHGGAFPIWLENAHCCPIAVVACYSGSSQDDHHLVVNTVRDYLNKIMRNSGSASGPSMPIPSVPNRESHEWDPSTVGGSEFRRAESPYEQHRDEHRDETGTFAMA